MKKVLVLTTFYKPFIGGAEVSVAEIIKLLGADFSFMVLTARHTRVLPRQEKNGGVTIRRLGIGCALDKFLFPFLVPFHALFLKFDLVYAVMATYAGAGALFIRLFLGKPYILNIQSGTLDTPAYRRITRFLWPLYARIHSAAASLHVISRSLGKRARALGVDSNRIVVIPNGIDPAMFKKRSLQRNSNRMVIVAQHKKVKGLIYAVRSIPAIVQRYPACEFIFIGDGPERKYLEQCASDLGVSAHARFAGMVPHDALPPILNSGNIFILPSLAEGFGVAAVEAMASGMVVIASRVGGIPDIITDRYNGLLIDPADSHGISQSVIELLNNPVFADELRARGALSSERYHWLALYTPLKELFNSV